MVWEKLKAFGSTHTQVSGCGPNFSLSIWAHMLCWNISAYMWHVHTCKYNVRVNNFGKISCSFCVISVSIAVFSCMNQPTARPTTTVVLAMKTDRSRPGTYNARKTNCLVSTALRGYIEGEPWSLCLVLTTNISNCKRAGTITACSIVQTHPSLSNCERLLL